MSVTIESRSRCVPVDQSWIELSKPLNLVLWEQIVIVFVLLNLELMLDWIIRMIYKFAEFYLNLLLQISDVDFLFKLLGA